jgi:GNAT superfamily N-acetyltransferase
MNPMTPPTFQIAPASGDFVGQTEDLFAWEGIQVSSEERPLAVAVVGEEVVGALTFGTYPDEDGLRVTFSIVVEEGYRRQGIARALVQRALDQAGSRLSGYYFRVWVVNPHMASLLGSMGFETENGEWSEDAPHMYLYA